VRLWYGGGLKSENWVIDVVVLQFVGYEWFFHDSSNSHIKNAKIKLDASNFVLQRGHVNMIWSR
jgi:hypothetical protein